MKRRAGPKRSAFTLIEMLISISFGSSMMLVAVALLHQAFELQGLAQQRSQTRLRFDRYIELFRNDVHRAVRAEAPSASELRLTLADGQQLAYVASDKALSRVPLESVGIGREELILPQGFTAAFEISSDQPLVHLSIQPTVKSTEQRLARSIEVAIGRLATSNS